MGSSKSSNAILAIVRSKFGNRIEYSDFAQMAELKSVEAVAEHIRSRLKFQKEMESSGISVWRRGNLETVLNRYCLNEIYSICGFERKIGDPVFKIYMISIEADEIIRFMRFLVAGHPEKYIFSMPDRLSELSDIDLEKMALIRSEEQFIDFLANSDFYSSVVRIYKDTNNFSINPATFEADLDRLTRIKSAEIIKDKIPKDEQKELLKIIDLKAEAIDIETIYRAKFLFGYSGDIIRSLLCSEGAYLSPGQINALISSENEEEYIRILKSTKYKRFMGDLDSIENFNFADVAVMSYAVHCIHFSTCPASVTFSYIVYSYMEMKNIIRIIEGVRYSIKGEEIMKNLIICGKES